MTPPVEKLHYLSVVASGEYEPGLLDALIHVIENCQCFISDCHMKTYGNSFILTCQLSGLWSTIAKVEVMLSQTAKPWGIDVQIRRTFYDQGENACVPYSIQIIGIERVGLASEVLTFFARQGFEVVNFFSESFNIQRSQTRMQEMTLTLQVPPKTHIATLRERFLTFCDDKNIDGLIEPIKSQPHGV